MDKPDWKDAPDWAMWLAQDNDGRWFWWGEKPVVTGGHEDFWMPEDPNPDAKFCRSGKDGKPPIDWTKTLEPRP